MKIANDNPKLSFLLPLCHSCSLLCHSCSLLSFLLPFCHSCESRNPVLIFVACEKEKATTLDPRLLMSRMTEGGEGEDDRRGEGEDDRRGKGEDDRGGKGEDDRGGKGEERGRGQTSRMTGGESGDDKKRQYRRSTLDPPVT